MLNIYKLSPMLALCVALIVTLTVHGAFREVMHLVIEPTAERAFADGLIHLSPSKYDVTSAEYFFKFAAMRDTTYPYVHHQLARVYFLTARYPEALAEINKEISNDPGKTRSSPYYMRGLIEGYMREYDAAVADYKEYVRLQPDRWEGRTDYAWVLIKTGDFKEAERVVDAGLIDHPENPWLLSMRATILFEAGDLARALPAARTAKNAVGTLTESAWMAAYPGNAPEAARTGIKTLQDAATHNLEKITSALVLKNSR